MEVLTSNWKTILRCRTFIWSSLNLCWFFIHYAITGSSRECANFFPCGKSFFPGMHYTHKRKIQRWAVKKTLCNRVLPPLVMGILKSAMPDFIAENDVFFLFYFVSWAVSSQFVQRIYFMSLIHNNPWLSGKVECKKFPPHHGIQYTTAAIFNHIKNQPQTNQLHDVMLQPLKGS